MQNLARLGWTQRLAWGLILTLAALFFTVRLGHEPLWLDETYSFAMTSHALIDILRLTQGDVHPPLYYLTLKLARSLFGASPFALRLPSLLGTLALIGLGMGPVRRLWGDRTAYLYALLVATSPGILCFAQEARMYTMAAFFVTGAVLYGQLVLTDPQRRDRFWFCLFTFAAALTHYFALVAVAMNGILLFGFAALRWRARFKSVLVNLLVATGLYLPWSLSFIHQVTLVTGGFWIPKPTLPLVTFGLVAPFTYKFEDVAYPKQALLALGLVFAVAATTLLSKKLRGGPYELLMRLHLLGIYLLTLGFVWAWSAWKTPIFMPRYMMTCSGLMLLFTAASIARLPRFGYVFATTVVLVGLGLPAWLRIQRETFGGPFAELAQAVREAGTPAPMLLHNDPQSLYPSWHAVPEARHVMVTEKGTSFDVSGGGVYDTQRLSSTDDLSLVLDQSNRLWIVDVPFASLHVDAERVLSQPGWKQKGPVVPLELPWSWVKARLTRYEKLSLSP